MKGSDAYIAAFNALSCGEGRVQAEAKRAEYVVEATMIYGVPGGNEGWEWSCTIAIPKLDGMSRDAAIREAVEDFRRGRTAIARRVLGDVDYAKAYAAVDDMDEEG